MKYIYIFLTSFFVVFIWSAIQPHDYFTWILEVFPAIIGLAILSLTFKNFRLTNITYFFITLHMIILCIGGHYTYAEVPLFDTIKELFHQTRNNYDKVGHFAQGFVPALIIHELFIRKSIINQKSWRNVLTVALCLAISACYEFLEWGVSIFSGESADSFLGTQGYVWDTQSDMLYATIGAITAIIFFNKILDKKMEDFKPSVH